jgi:uncharacterized integral membrane protein
MTKVLSDAGFHHPETDGRAMSQAEHQEAEHHESDSRTTKVARTRVSASWTAVVVAAFLLVLLIIFVAQNTQRSSVNFLWLHGTAPAAVVILIAAAVGALVVVIVGVARILQLRRAARTASHSE